MCLRLLFGPLLSSYTVAIPYFRRSRFRKARRSYSTGFRARKTRRTRFNSFASRSRYRPVGYRGRSVRFRSYTGTRRPKPVRRSLFSDSRYTGPTGRQGTRSETYARSLFTKNPYTDFLGTIAPVLRQPTRSGDFDYTPFNWKAAAQSVWRKSVSPVVQSVASGVWDFFNPANNLG